MPASEEGDEVNYTDERLSAQRGDGARDSKS